MNRPPPYKFPDPVAWEALHGLKPYALAKVPPFLATNAAAAIQQDWSTLDTETVHGLQAELDTVFETVEATFHVPVGHEVHFDGTQFWVFPRPEKLPAAAERMPLMDAVEHNRQHPETFLIPSDAELEEIHAGDFVQLCAAWSEGPKGIPKGERFWVQVSRQGHTALSAGITPRHDTWQGVIEQTDMVYAHIHGYQTETPVEFTSRNVLKTMTAAALLSGTVQALDKPKK